MQSTNSILMIRPANFRSNEQTEMNNYFQSDLDLSPEKINELAQVEFDAFVAVLRNAGVRVIVVEDLQDPNTPDALFPNNWVSFHDTGMVVLYPMFAANRRQERRMDVLARLEDEGFHIEDIMDYTRAEEDDLFLEGTGSIVLDREHKKAYCGLSPRADEELVIEFCEDLEYTPVIFTAYQSVNGERLPIYHTNVMMCVADQFAIICAQSIDDKAARKNVLRHLREDGKEIIQISEEQMHAFAGNMLQVQTEDGKSALVMSTAAYESLDTGQISRIESYGPIIHSSLSTIETCGGGSARCMMAEVFLPKN
ncbi:MAG: amidinotransferase [Bacteroidia bacterium]|nr:amidinotransferase [Bacteroidia bacterium]